ncbi:PIN domain-containing protein [Leucobacter sp. OH2974_COT-288]|nr:PIN domain-containing protein [Leucobacter sp. OH2974_COT-288]
MTEQTYRVLLDANILYSRTLRDWICLLSYETENRFFQLYSSEDIIIEAGYHWRKTHPDKSGFAQEQIFNGIRGAMYEVASRYGTDKPPKYPDPGDYHVHSAAVACEVDALVTADDKLLEYAQSSYGDELPYETLTADEFLMQLTEYVPLSVFVKVFTDQEEYWSNPKNNRKLDAEGVDLPRALVKAGAPNFAEFVRRRVIPELRD